MPLVSQFKRKEAADVWSDPESFGTALLALFVDEFDFEALDWEPETIHMEIADTWSVRVPPTNMDKLLSLIAALKTDGFYVDVPTFIHTCNALNGAPVNFEHYDPVEPEEAAWAITEIGMLAPPKNDEEFESRFSADVRGFVGVILDFEGIRGSPDALYIAERQPEETTGSFSEDPAMYAAFFQKSSERENDIRAYVKQNAQALYAQLQKLPVAQENKTWQAFLSRYKQWSTKVPSPEAE